MKDYFFEDLYNNSKDLIQSISPQGKFLYVNQAWLKAFNYKLSDIKNMDVFSVVHPDSYDDFKKIFEQIMSKETAKKIERITFIKEDGAQIYLEGNISSKFIDHDPAYMRCFFKDITKRVKSEQNLQVLNYITQKLYETNDLDKAYTIALDKVCELDYVDIASIYLVDKTTNEAVLQDHRNLSKEYLEKASRIPFSKGITWKVVNSGKIVNIRDIQKSKELGQAGRNLGIRSFVGIPIKVEKSTIGVLWLLSLKEYYFSKNEVELLNSIGNQIAIAIGRAKSYIELAKISRYENIINIVSQSAHKSIDLQKVMNNAVSSLVDEIDSVQNAAIYFVEGKEVKYAVLQSYKGFPMWFIKKIRKIPYPKGFTWKTIIDAKTRYCPDVDNDEYIGPSGREVGIKSYLSTPIKHKEEVIGCININSFKRNAFDETELKLLDNIAKQVETAIQNAKQAEELKNSEKNLRLSIEQLNKKRHYDQIISSVANSVHKSINLKEVFENTVDSIINNIEIIKHVGLHIVENNVAVMKAHRGHPKWFVKKVKRLEYPRGLTWKTISEGKMIYCPDVSKDNAIGPAGREVGTKSYVSMPITISGNTIGCINVHSELINPFSEDELILLETVTSQIEIAINNAQQAEKLKTSEEILKKNILKLSKKQSHDEISNTILKSLHKSIKLKDVMENAVEAISNNMPEVENIMIFLVEGKKAILQAHRGHPKWIVDRLREIPYGKGFTWKALLSGKFIYVKDAENDITIGHAGKKLGTKSYIAIPIKLSGKAVGVININSLRKNAFDNDDISVLKKVSKQLEIAINNANKAEALSKSQDELKDNILLLKKKSRYDEIISNISRSVHKSIDLPLVMNNAVQSIVNNIDIVNGVCIYLVEEKFAVIQSFKGFPKWFIKKVYKIPYPKGLTWETINEGKPIYCPNTDKDKNIGPAGRKIGTKSYFSIPFQYKNKNIGCIHFSSKQKNAFNQEELNLLEIVATQIETAINNAKLAEALKESEERFRNMADTTPVMIWMSDNNKKCNYVNKTWLEFTGKSLKQGLNGSWMECIYKDDVNNYINTYENAFDNKNEFKLEYRLRRHDGEYRWILDHGIPRFLTDGEFAGYIGSCIDIDDRITAEKEIKQSLHEKELLLKELHHRVKNNLQIVSSLLSLQSDNINDKKVLEMFNSSRSRIDSMALIHEQLYSSPDFDRIDLSVYIKNLCRNIRDSLDQGLNVIELNMEIERIVKDINFAIPFSLILNELVSNAFKHAFPNNNNGNILIKFEFNSKKEMILSVNDDGVGLPENIDIYNTQSMGMQLISALAVQLNAKIQVNRNNGTLFELRFLNK